MAVLGRVDRAERLRDVCDGRDAKRDAGDVPGRSGKQPGNNGGAELLELAGAGSGTGASGGHVDCGDELPAGRGDQSDCEWRGGGGERAAGAETYVGTD